MKTKINHLAIILDGNRRWAKQQGLPSLEGHRRGYDKIKEVGDWCLARGIKILTVYAFSTENWKRDKKEVDYLMKLLRLALTKELSYFIKRDIKVRVIGRREELSPAMRAAISHAEEVTKNNKAGTINLAINYGGRQEIVAAVKSIVSDGALPEQINENLISEKIWTSGQSDPDLIIRTSGEQRLSGFLTWQSVYSELYFMSVYWPDFSEKDLDEAITWFENRERRFGVG